MRQGKNSKPRKLGAVNVNQFPSLESITRPTVPTNDAAYYLNREPQTLRTWHSLGTGPIRPTRIYGKLAWPVEQIRVLLGGE